MEREERYIVLKLKDLIKYCSASELGNLHQISVAVENGRAMDLKLPLQCVVVESDWPEYENTWLAIEKRVEGDAQ